MSVIIKGVDMPENCKRCDLRYSLSCLQMHKSIEGYVNGKQEQPQRPNWCPLVPLPEKHGALIDRDDFFAECSELAEEYKCISDSYVVVRAEESEVDNEHSH